MSYYTEIFNRLAPDVMAPEQWVAFKKKVRAIPGIS